MLTKILNSKYTAMVLGVLTLGALYLVGTNYSNLAKASTRFNQAQTHKKQADKQLKTYHQQYDRYQYGTNNDGQADKPNVQTTANLRDWMTKLNTYNTKSDYLANKDKVKTHFAKDSGLEVVAPSGKVADQISTYKQTSSVNGIRVYNSGDNGKYIVTVNAHVSTEAGGEDDRTISYDVTYKDGQVTSIKRQQPTPIVMENN